MRLLTHHRVGVVALYMLVWLLAGTLGYARVEGWGLWDSLYMTAITLTAVGYNEVHPLTQGGRVLTMVLLFGGLTGLGLWFALLTSMIVQFDLRDVFRKRKMSRGLKTMKNHVIVCGAGRMGRQVMLELAEARQPFVAIELSESRIQHFLEDHPDTVFVHGDATQDQTLKEAGLDEATGLLSCLRHDTDNLFVCLSARAISSDLTIVARAEEEASVPKMYRAGATHVVSPNVSGAIQMASVMVRPAVMSFLDVTTRAPQMSLRLEEALIPEGSPLAGVTLAEAQIPQHTGLIVIALKNGVREDEFEFNPVGTTRLEPGNNLIVLGTDDQLERLNAFVGGDA